MELEEFASVFPEFNGWRSDQPRVWVPRVFVFIRRSGAHTSVLIRSTSTKTLSLSVQKWRTTRHNPESPALSAHTPVVTLVKS